MIKTLYPTYQRWSEKGSVYLVSDTHFADGDCQYMDSNWPSPEEYIENTLKQLTKNDTLIHLGDVGDVSYLKDIKCYKVLIMGNHDVGMSHYLRKVRLYDYDFPTEEDAIKAKHMGAIDYYDFSFHSPFIRGYVDNHLFDEVYSGPLFIADKLVLSHEPICVTAGITGEPIAFNIHGHDHSGEYYNDDYHLNIAANVVGYRLISLKDIIKHGFLSDKSIKSIHRCIIDRATERKNG